MLQNDDYKGWFENLYVTHYERLLAYAIIITRDADLAKDAVSEVFLSIWNHKRNGQELQDVAAYLSVCVKNTSLRMLSKNPNAFDQDQYDIVSLSVDNINPEDILIGKELETLVKKITDDLPPVCGIVFQLIRRENKSYKEVAEELDISIDTVKYHMKKAIYVLSRGLKDHGAKTKVINWIASAVLFVSLFYSLLIL